MYYTVLQCGCHSLWNMCEKWPLIYWRWHLNKKESVTSNTCLFCGTFFCIRDSSIIQVYYSMVITSRDDGKINNDNWGNKVGESQNMNRNQDCLLRINARAKENTPYCENLSESLEFIFIFRSCFLLVLEFCFFFVSHFCIE